ncbi:hypothetical protein AKO1_013272 [Acrasis kona]|uniref:Uncharacterized protein n=1 Tax=Acrasis kona TaxID=1008807 RepID=A0AAW2YY95_9EUKA
MVIVAKKNRGENEDPESCIILDSMLITTGNNQVEVIKATRKKLSLGKSAAKHSFIIKKNNHTTGESISVKIRCTDVPESITWCKEINDLIK